MKNIIKNNVKIEQLVYKRNEEDTPYILNIEEDKQAKVAEIWVRRGDYGLSTFVLGLETKTQNWREMLIEEAIDYCDNRADEEIEEWEEDSERRTVEFLKGKYIEELREMAEEGRQKYADDDKMQGLADAIDRLADRTEKELKKN